MSQDNFTSLVGVKWSHESISKIHFKMFYKFLKQIQQTKKFTEEEKEKRIRDMLEWFTLIENLCINKELTIKK